jgi:lipopolysaccharide export system permease protein
MGFNSIINRYIFKEMIPPFLVNLGFFTFIFLMTMILDITNLVVNYRISLVSVCLMLLYSMPFFLVFVIPMSTMMTALLTFLRMSADNEILAMKAGGVSIYRLLPPVLLFSLITCGMTGCMSIYGVPWGNRSIKALTIQAAASNIDAGLKERTFNDSFKDVMMYLNKIDIKTKELIDVFIEDQRNKNTVSAVIAPRGKLFKDPDKYTYHLRLYDGIINQVDIKTKAVHSIHFDSYDIVLDLKKALSNRKEGPKNTGEMSLGEMRHYLDTATEKDIQYYVTLIDYHKKFAIPFACLTLGLLAVPLGVQARTTKRSLGLALGIGFFLLYYIMLSAGWVFGESGELPPVIGMWIPNVVMAAVGFYLLVRSAHERPVRMAFLSRTIEWAAAKVFKNGDN